MASEVISHAIFASSHPTSAPHCLPLRLLPRFPPALHPAQHSASHSALHPAFHPALHSASRLSCTPTLHPIMRFTQHLDPHSHPYPLAKPLPPSHSIFLPSTHFPSASLHPSLFLSQAPSPRIPSCPSPCAPTPFHTTHFHRTSLLPRIPLAKSLPPRHSIFLPSAFLHPPCSSAKPLHPASHHALHPAHRPHSSPPISHPRLSIPPCSSAKSRLWIFSCVKRPGSLTT